MAPCQMARCLSNVMILLLFRLAESQHPYGTSTIFSTETDSTNSSHSDPECLTGVNSLGYACSVPTAQLIFIHIPKTGGTSVRTILKAMMPYVKPPFLDLENKGIHHLFASYVPEGFHFSFVRDPVERWRSNYLFCRGLSDLIKRNIKEDYCYLADRYNFNDWTALMLDQIEYECGSDQSCFHLLSYNRNHPWCSGLMMPNCLGPQTAFLLTKHGRTNIDAAISLKRAFRPIVDLNTRRRNITLENNSNKVTQADQSDEEVELRTLWVGKLEHFSRDIKCLLRCISPKVQGDDPDAWSLLQSLLPYQHMVSEKNLRDQAYQLAEQTLNRIQLLFRPDFELFGYDINRWKKKNTTPLETETHEKDAQIAFEDWIDFE